MEPYLVEHVLELILGQSTALHIFDSTELLGHAFTILPPYWRHLLLSELLADARVVAQIDLGADDEAGDAGTVMMNFGEPLLADVLEGGWGGDAEADEENVGLGV
jgi:hypothetical protein